MAARYLYQRSGGPLVTWNRMRPPGQTKAAPGSLGSLGATDVFDQPRRLPRGGAPEYIADGFGATAIEYGEAIHAPPAQRAMARRRSMGDDAVVATAPSGGMFSSLPIFGPIIQGVADVVAGGASVAANAVTGGDPGIVAPPAPTGIVDTVAAKLGVSSSTVLLGAAGIGAYFLFKKKGR